VGVFARAVLAALEAAARGGEDYLARRALARADPLVAWYLRRRVAADIRWAAACVADPSDRAHVLRLAYLREASADADLNPEDRASVAGAFESRTSSAGRPPRFWVFSATLVVVAAAAAAIAALASYRATKDRFDPSAVPLARALGTDLTEYVAGVSRWRAARRAGEAGDLTFTAPRDRAQAEVAGLGQPLAGAVIDLFRAYQAAALTPEYDRATLDSLTGEVQRLDGTLSKLGEPYFVDFLQLADGEPVLTTYYVAAERMDRAEGANIRLLRVQRLDRLNRSMALLGYTSPRLGAAVVALDMIERDLVAITLPALADGASARLVDPETREQAAAWIAEAETAGGRALRRDYASYRSEGLDRLVALVTRREAIVRGIADTLGGTRMRIGPPVRLVTDDRLDELAGLVSTSVRNEWSEVNDAIASEPSRRAFDSMVDVWAARIERHELQHQVDYRRGLVPMPEPLAAIFGVEDATLISPTSNAARARDELSAVLASIALDPELAGSLVVQSAATLFDRRLWATPHAYGNAVILATLSTELGAPGVVPIGPTGFDRAAAKDLFSAVVAHSGAEIAAAAARAYVRLFGYPLPTVDVGPLRASRRWRN
jgi:hypothetical protein